MVNQEFRVPNSYQYNRSSPVRWIISHIWRHKWFMIAYFAGVLGANGANVFIPVLTGRAFDAVVTPDDMVVQTLVTIALTMLAIILTRAVADLSGQYAMEVIAKRLERDARDELYLNLLGKSQTWHNQQRVGDLMARANNDVREINGMMMPGFSLLFDSMVALVLPIIVIGTTNYRLLLAPAIFVVMFVWALRRYMDELTPVSDRLREGFGEMNATLAETVTGIEVVKINGQEQQEIGKFGRAARTYRDYFVEQGFIQARYLPPFLLGVAITIGFLHGVYLLSEELLTIGELVTYIGLLFLLRYPSFISTFTFVLVELGVASARRILDLLSQETDIDENENGHAESMAGDVVFENVTFQYGESAVLEDISFRARPGETIAIVGQTGSGKSTLTKLVNRTYDVSAGRILIDGIDLRQWKLDTLRRQISTIEQDIVLFSRDVAANISFGARGEITREQVMQVAREAQAHDFIMQFKDGYDTEVGERGVTLSGGQRQRLAIARALLTDPRILILDDATSAIDSATEDRIQTAIDRILEGRTTFLITHRLSQIRRADRIIVLAKGKIIDQGGHEELLGRCRLYQRIFGVREEIPVNK
ncbi:MAG: ABC transporter ATP-binding protein [Ardenticatenaceae bacterium]|nr:ABC transporter ATP-binding protein [Ardenticatenaceae bacterium]